MHAFRIEYLQDWIPSGLNTFRIEYLQVWIPSILNTIRIEYFQNCIVCIRIELFQDWISLVLNSFPFRRYTFLEVLVQEVINWKVFIFEGFHFWRYSLSLWIHSDSPKYKTHLVHVKCTSMPSLPKVHKKAIHYLSQVRKSRNNWRIFPQFFVL